MARNAPLALARNLPKHGVMIKILREEKPSRKAYLNMNEFFLLIVFQLTEQRGEVATPGRRPMEEQRRPSSHLVNTEQRKKLV